MAQFKLRYSLTFSASHWGEEETLEFFQVIEAKNLGKAKIKAINYMKALKKEAKKQKLTAKAISFHRCVYVVKDVEMKWKP